MVTRHGAWHYRVSAGTGLPGVSMVSGQESRSDLAASVWQHVQLSKQICPLDTLACCLDVKQAINKQT